MEFLGPKALNEIRSGSTGYKQIIRVCPQPRHYPPPDMPHAPPPDWTTSSGWPRNTGLAHEDVDLTGLVVEPSVPHSVRTYVKGITFHDGTHHLLSRVCFCWGLPPTARCLGPGPVPIAWAHGSIGPLGPMDPMDAIDFLGPRP
jgi:hypothetical protein